jgi:galactose-6-phosphate isomerase
MPLLDVSEIIADADFSDDIVVIRSNRTVDAHGRTVDVPGSFNTYANVQPAPQSALQILPDNERVGSFISVVTPFRLIPLTDTTAPDQVQWSNRTYRVKMLRDWSTYGNGFVEAICELTSMTIDGPP